MNYARSLSLLTASLLLMSAVVGCGDKAKVSVPPSGNKPGTIEDKPSTSASQPGANITTDLAAPARTVGETRALINLEFAPAENVTALRVVNTQLSTKCADVSYYFTWSELGPENQVINESAQYTMNVVHGRRYLLRLYSARLRGKCSARVTYHVTPVTADADDAALLWPKISYNSVGLISSGGLNTTLKLETPAGLGADSSDVSLKLTRSSKLIGGPWRTDTLVNIDGLDEKLQVQAGLVSAQCTSGAQPVAMPVGTVTDAVVSIDKQVLSSSANCGFVARTFRLAKVAHGLVELSLDSVANPKLHAFLAPMMGLSQTSDH